MMCTTEIGVLSETLHYTTWISVLCLTRMESLAQISCQKLVLNDRCLVIQAKCLYLIRCIQYKIENSISNLVYSISHRCWWTSVGFCHQVRLSNLLTTERVAILISLFWLLNDKGTNTFTDNMYTYYVTLNG